MFEMFGTTLRSDATAECPECGMPLIPYARAADRVLVECANRHHGEAPLPTDPSTVHLIDNWISKRGAQLHEQHERWGTDDI